MESAFVDKTIESGSKVKIAGVIDEIKYKKTKSGATMVVFKISDETGQIDVRAFPEKLENRGLLEDDNIVILEGVLEVDEEQEKVSMTANSIESIESLTKEIKGIRIKLSREKASNGVLEKIKDVLSKNKGNKEVVVVLYNGKKPYCEIALHSDFHVNYDENFKYQMLNLLSEKELEVY